MSEVLDRAYGIKFAPPPPPAECEARRPNGYWAHLFTRLQEEVGKDAYISTEPTKDRAWELARNARNRKRVLGVPGRLIFTNRQMENDVDVYVKWIPDQTSTDPMRQ